MNPIALAALVVVAYVVVGALAFVAIYMMATS